MVEAVANIGTRVKLLPSFSLADAIAGLVAEQEGRFFLWSPVILIAGIWTYFAPPIEPAPLVFVFVLPIAILLAWAMLREKGGIAVRLACIFLIGFSLAKLRTEIVAAPVISAATGEALLAGAIERIDRKSPRSAVVTLRVSQLEGTGVTTKPDRVRLSVTGSKAAVLSPGMTISASARLAPLPSPAMPGGFDYGRVLWFQGIGATGRAFGNLQVTRDVPHWRDWP